LGLISAELLRIWSDQWPDSAKSGQLLTIAARFQVDSCLPESGDGGRMSPDSDASIISIAGRAGFRQSDMKCACKDEEFNFEKRFTILKIVNSFPKIKEAFMIKLKMISIYYYFRPYFRKSFYAETNGA
jgi:hypothetical protein